MKICLARTLTLILFLQPAPSLLLHPTLHSHRWLNSSFPSWHRAPLLSSTPLSFPPSRLPARAVILVSYLLLHSLSDVAVTVFSHHRNSTLQASRVSTLAIVRLLPPCRTSLFLNSTVLCVPKIKG